MNWKIAFFSVIALILIIGCSGIFFMTVCGATMQFKVPPSEVEWK